MKWFIVFFSLFPVMVWGNSCNEISTASESGVIGGTGFTCNANCTINNNDIDDAEGTSPTPSGEMAEVPIDLPENDPVSFPSFSGVEDITYTSMDNSIPSGVYGDIVLNKAGATLTFNGSDDYKIEKFVASKSGTIQLDGGNYFFNSFEAKNRVTIEASADSKVYINTSFNLANKSSVNASGATTNLIFYLYSGATFQIGNSEMSNSDVDFNAIVYSPFEDTSIDFGNNNDITGAILSEGTVNVGSNTDFNYTAEVQAEIVEGLGCELANHIRIEHDGEGEVDVDESVTIKICADEACTQYVSYQDQASFVLTSSPSSNTTWTSNPLNTVNGIGSINFSASTEGFYTLDIATDGFYIGGSLQSSYTPKCYNTATAVLNDCNMIVDAGSSGPDHYHISHGNIGVTCNAETITVTAHNSDHTEYTVSSDTDLTVSALPVTDSITSSPVTILSGNSSVTFTLSETTATAAPHIDINVTDGSKTESSGDANSDPAIEHDPKLQFVDALLQFVTSTSIPPTTEINTQTGGLASTQSLYLRAVKSNNIDGVNVCEPGLSAVTQTMQLGYQCISPNDCSNDELTIDNQSVFNTGSDTLISHNDGVTTSNTQGVDLTFNASGYAPLSFRYDNVGQISLFVNDYILSGATLSGSRSDEFVVKPYEFCIQPVDGAANFDATSVCEADVNGDYHTCSGFKKAGESFNLQIKALLYSNAASSQRCSDYSVATLYEASNIALASEVVSPQLGSDGILLTQLTSLSSAHQGERSDINQSISEVGAFKITLIPETYLGEDLGSYQSETIGRFYPANFSIDSINHGIFENTCTGGTSDFTYVGETFTFSDPPDFVLSAMNELSLPTVTTNYTGDWAKIMSTADFSTNAVSVDTTNSLGVYLDTTGNMPNLDTPVDNADGTFDVSFTVDDFCYGDSSCLKQDAAIILPFTADIDLILESVSDGEVESTVNQLFEPTGNEQRFGRLKLLNTNGSEQTAITMDVVAQYFDGDDYVTNTDDNCSIVTDTYLSYSGTLSSGGSTTLSMNNTTAMAGEFAINLSAPGSGNTGDLAVMINLSSLAWLRYDWDDDDQSADGPHDDDPFGLASFGIFKGNPKQIYIRQIFN